MSKLVTSSKESRPEHFFESLERAFEKSRQDTGSFTQRYYSIGPYRIKINFAGTSLSSFMTRALEHLSSPPESIVDLEIFSWDGQTSGITIDDLPGKSSDLPHWTYRGERFEAISYVSRWGLSMVDFKTNRAFFWVTDANQIRPFEIAKPFRDVFHLWMSRRGVELIHGAVLRKSSKGLLLVGKMGAGKSTSALSCLKNGFSYLSDDVALIRHEPFPFAFGLYNTAKISPEKISEFPFLQKGMENSFQLESGKILFYINDCLPESVIKETTIDSILIQRQTGKKETVLRPCSRMESLRTLSTSTLFELMTSTSSAFYRFSQLINKVPSFVLEAGTDLDRLSEAVNSHVSRQ